MQKISMEKIAIANENTFGSFGHKSFGQGMPAYNEQTKTPSTSRTRQNLKEINRDFIPHAEGVSSEGSLGGGSWLKKGPGHKSISMLSDARGEFRDLLLKYKILERK